MDTTNGKPNLCSRIKWRIFFEGEEERSWTDFKIHTGKREKWRSEGRICLNAIRL